jgi:hypothetical protein
MKHFLVTILFALTINSLLAQGYTEITKKNTVFLEVGGNGPLYSINYDRILIKKTNWKLAGRIGFMYFNDNRGLLENSENKQSSIPIELSFLKGKSNHNLELGLGITPLSKGYLDKAGKDYTRVATSGRIGYRYQKSNGGLFFKAGFTPITFFKKDFNSVNPKYVYPWAGLALGYTIR